MKRLWGIIFVIGIAASALLYHHANSRNDPEKIPEGIFGKWQTEDPRYADRYFELYAAHVTFGFGEGKTAVYELVRIDRAPGEKPSEYNLIFADEDGNRYSQSFYFAEKSPSVLRFKNRDEIEWQKVDVAD